MQQIFESKIMPTWEDSAPDRVLETFKASSPWPESFLKPSNGKPKYWWYGQIWIKYLTEGCGEVLAPPGNTGLEAAGVDKPAPASPKRAGLLSPFRNLIPGVRVDGNRNKDMGKALGVSSRRVTLTFFRSVHLWHSPTAALNLAPLENREISDTSNVRQQHHC